MLRNFFFKRLVRHPPQKNSRRRWQVPFARNRRWRVDKSEASAVVSVEAALRPPSRGGGTRRRDTCNGRKTMISHEVCTAPEDHVQLFYPGYTISISSSSSLEGMSSPLYVELGVAEDKGALLRVKTFTTPFTENTYLASSGTPWKPYPRATAMGVIWTPCSIAYFSCFSERILCARARPRVFEFNRPFPWVGSLSPNHGREYMFIFYNKINSGFGNRQAAAGGEKMPQAHS